MSGKGGEVFSNQQGLQFITLFSLVIAIILFGVLKILEAKELSALLARSPATCLAVSRRPR